jgi:hypothetical protein
LFSASITSYLFERVYFKYAWLDITNYKDVLDYFIKGSFFIPFTLFLIVHFGIGFLSFSIFHIINHFLGKRSLKSIYEYEAKQSEIRLGIKLLRKGTQFIVPFNVNESVLIDAYNEIKSELKTEKVEEIEKDLRKQKQNIENSFGLVFRGLIALSIYFASIQYFGVILFGVSSFIIFCFFILCFFTYKLLDVAPTLVRKYHKEVEKYISERQFTAVKPSLERTGISN